MDTYEGIRICIRKRGCICIRIRVRIRIRLHLRLRIGVRIRIRKRVRVQIWVKGTDNGCTVVIRTYYPRSFY